MTNGKAKKDAGATTGGTTAASGGASPGPAPKIEGVDERLRAAQLENARMAEVTARQAEITAQAWREGLARVPPERASRWSSQVAATAQTATELRTRADAAQTLTSTTPADFAAETAAGLRGTRFNFEEQWLRCTDAEAHPAAYEAMPPPEVYARGLEIVDELLGAK